MIAKMSLSTMLAVAAVLLSLGFCYLGYKRLVPGNLKVLPGPKGETTRDSIDSSADCKRLSYCGKLLRHAETRGLP